MASVIHTWVTRAYCPECSQYLWTTPGSPSVVCRCTASEIQEDVVLRGDAITSSYDFREAVIADTGIPSEDLDLTHEAPA